MHWPTSLEDIGIVNFIAAIAVLANVAGYLMKTMIPLRVIASTVAISCQLNCHVPVREMAEQLIPGFAEPV